MKVGSSEAQSGDHAIKGSKAEVWESDNEGDDDAFILRDLHPTLLFLISPLDNSTNLVYVSKSHLHGKEQRERPTCMNISCFYVNTCFTPIIGT